MTLFDYLQLQEVEPEDANSDLDQYKRDEITLDDSIDGKALDDAWRSILQSESPEG